MKKLIKRIIAVMCVFVLVVSSNWYGISSNVSASTETNVGEWLLYSNASGEAFWRNGANGLEFSKNNASVDLPSTTLKENLVLALKFNITDEDALTSLEAGVVELAQETCDHSEICWVLANRGLQVGMNEIRLSLTDTYSTDGNTGPFSLESTIKYFRLYSITDAGEGTATLYEAKLIDTSISISDEKIEWSLIEAGTQLNAAIENGQTDNSMYNLTATTGTVETDKSGPEAGTVYSKTIVPARDTETGTGGRIGFNPGYQGHLGMNTVTIPDTYTQDDLSLTFWLYSSTGNNLPGGGIGLASGGWNGNDEIRWVVGGLAIQQGWNYIELPLNDYDFSWGTFDYQNINFVHWYTDGYLTEETEFRITDIKLTAPLKADDTTQASYLVGEIPFTLDKTFQATGSTAVTVSAEKVFDEIDASGRDTSKLQLLMDVEVENLTNPNDLSDFALFSGQLELTSGGTCDVEEISTSISTLNWRSGKHEYAINLSSLSGTIDYASINYMRIYLIIGEGNTTDELRIKINNVRLVDATNQKSTLPTLFGDGMLFQQNKPMNMWGYGTAGDAVTAKLYKGDTLLETRETVISENGRFEFFFSAREGSYDTYTIDVTVGKENIVVEDILIGELWIAGGQSNMELLVSKDMNAEEIVENASNPYIRMFLEPTYPFGSTGTQLIEPGEDVPNAYWGYGNNGAQVGNTSSVAYTFAKNLQEKLKVPVGIINSAIGGTVIEGWLSREAIEGDTEVKTALQEYGLYYNEDNWPTTAGTMSTLYNQKIGPLEGMNIAGVIWYQGESNSNRSEIYDIELDLLKRSWSKVFGFENEDMPFIFTQVAPYRYDNGMVNNQHLGYLAMYMERGWKLSENKNTAMLTVYDLPLDHVKDGVSTNPIHPRVKTPIGERFYKSAYNMVYGGNKEYTAPVYKSMEIKEHAIYITFEHVGAGLQLTDDSGDIHGFTIAGQDGVYVNAQAELIDKDTVMVWNERVAEPKNVMYAFDNFNQGANLCNSVEIPVSPFRTVDIDDTTKNPDATLSYFTAQDWMCADKDVWVYDSTNTENANMATGYRPSFAVNGGTSDYEYAPATKVEGNASLKVTYDDDFSVSPILSYESVKQDWSKFKYLSFDVQNPDEVSVSMTIQSSGETYTVCSVSGTDAVNVTATGNSFATVAFDLTNLKLDGSTVADTETVLNELTNLTIHVVAEQPGTMYFDAFSFGMTEAVEVEVSKPRTILYQETFSAGEAPLDADEYREEGYLFAGWFVNDTCTTALTDLNKELAENVYAKYVDARMLGVKAQISANLLDNKTDNDNEGAIRFVTTVDTLSYSKVGFVFRIGNAEQAVGSDEVYEVLYGVNDSTEESKMTEYLPKKEFCLSSQFFKTFTLTGFGKEAERFNYDTEISVTPYWITQDGTTVYGTCETKSIRMGLSN